VEDVDIKATENGGHYIGWVRDGEFARYTVEVETAGGCTARPRAWFLV